jgi:vacuolar-type H+-ATPase subunit H
MQERSRRDSEETLRSAKQEAAELTAKSLKEAETTLLRASQEAESIKELAESKSREMVENLGAKMVSLTADVNRLVTIKEGITSDLRHLLEDYLKNLEEGLPASLKGLQPLPPVEPVLPPREPLTRPVTFSAGPETVQRQTGLWGAAQLLDRQEAPPAATSDSRDDSLDNLYEKIDLAEDMLEPAPMTSAGTDRNKDEQFATMDLDDIESLDLEDTPNPDDLPSFAERAPRQHQNISIAGLEKDMLFTLEDPLDDLEPSISIRGNDDRYKR